MPRLWARIIKNNSIIQQDTCDCRYEDVEESLTELCREFDIPRPIWLHKHYREYGKFRRTAFLPEHFMEEVAFQRFEIEYLDDDNKNRRSSDPRNRFDGF